MIDIITNIPDNSKDLIEKIRESIAKDIYSGRRYKIRNNIAMRDLCYNSVRVKIDLLYFDLMVISTRDYDRLQTYAFNYIWYGEEKDDGICF